ncbi:hypothetical protein FN846DRAFT_915870 [Sphaerosporella brunnea]|uniref:F-box domain-containing protein n=1 Tax=Sphaerosporella brunnea TaxID=1250544 RepID=A0A5J5FA72_9PEZI|nr:hypothetical protein FN846DRAFT_915870 [Sphaerosporella brunnea]
MATLSTIPPELHIEILSRLPDLRSLAAAVLTSRAIYKAFTIARHDVMERVLNADIPLASIVGEIDCLLPQDCVAALQDRSSSVRGKALDMLCVHQGFVSGWCRRFCEDTLTALPSQHQGPASPSERLRIQRAFYRFWALSRAIAASGIKQPSISDDLSFAKTYMLRYSLWEIAELTLICRYIHQKLERLCFLHGRLVTDENIRKDTANELTVYSLALLDLPTLHSMLFSPQTTTSILDTHLSTQLSCYRTWPSLFTADRSNRDRDPTVFPPRRICTRRDVPSDEYDECLRDYAEDVVTVLGVERGEYWLEDDLVRYDLALWDDSRLERLGLFLPVA